ncbi:hypothetical protein [Stenotrophomonas sp. ATs4]|uniref:hypothetical protein n=1 Tax=Stenotrophomonas sp. ATs4 TaxID=3402766 RepID=UPI003F7097BD
MSSHLPVGKAAPHFSRLLALFDGIGGFALFLHGSAQAFAARVVTSGFQEFVGSACRCQAGEFVYPQCLARFRRCASPAAQERRPLPFLQRKTEQQRGQKGGAATRGFAVEPKRSPSSDEARARVFLVVTPGHV